MMWYGGDGWGWGGLIVNVLAMVVFWGAVIIAIGLAIHFLRRDRGDVSAPRDTGSTGAEDVLAERAARGEMDNDEFLPPSDVAARVALIAQIFHRRQITEVPGRSSDG